MNKLEVICSITCGSDLSVGEEFSELRRRRKSSFELRRDEADYHRSKHVRKHRRRVFG